jgi:anti-anti-sigma factor
VAVLRPSGELDLATSDTFRRDLRAALAGDPDRLVVDLADVSFLDSSGIAVLVSAFKAQRERQAELLVVNPQPIVQRALELVGLGTLIAAEDT